MKVAVRPAARRDIIFQVAYYLDELAFDAAERFPLAVEEAFKQIRQQPAMGSPRTFDNPKLAGLRSWPVPGFEDTRIYYLQPRPGLIRVVRVLHGSRDLYQIFEATPH